MWYVYCKHCETGRIECVGAYKTRKEAIERVYNLYKIDESLNLLGENYYEIACH